MSVRAYELLISAAPSRDDQQLLLTMQREERRHYYLLEGIYEELCGHACMVPRPALAMPKQYITMLQVMICNKLDNIEHYELLDKKLHCVKQRELLTIVISDQKEQARILATIDRRNN